MSQLEEGRAFTLKASAYAVIVALSALIAAYRGASLVTTDAWLGAAFELTPASSILVSVGLGAIVAGVSIWSTPHVLRLSSRARALHDDLRPTVRNASDASLVVMALASGIGEELFFRGALVPWLGVVVSSVLFGVLHQVRGSGRWVWVSWATAMGMVLAVVFRASGHLAGCIVAHVAVNAANLRLVRDHESERLSRSPEKPRPRELGGLLRTPAPERATQAAPSPETTRKA